MRVRMKDVAREVGVSVVTVSKVLRGHRDIGEETRKAVLRRIKELNYRPNASARALVTGRTQVIGLVIPDLVHSFFAEVAKGVSRVLRSKNYSLIISSSEEDPDLEKDEIEQLLTRQVDALIIASTQSSVESFRRIEEQKTPYVLVDRRFSGLAANFIGVDDEEVGALATQHLMESGYRRIAHVRGPENSAASGRLEGYRRALTRRGIPVVPGYIVAGKSGDDAGDISGYHAMMELLAQSPRPDAVFCYNDPMAMGVIKALLEAGLRIPQDIAVLGCGNIRASELFRVPLSSIDQDSEGIGERAAKLALNLVEAKHRVTRPRTVLLPARLVVRESTRGVKAEKYPEPGDSSTNPSKAVAAEQQS